MELEKLKELGLTEQQAAIYLKLLEFGHSDVGKLAKQLDLPRISCYDTLNRLSGKGLVSFVQARGKRLYQAVDPVKLLQISQEKEQQAKKQRECIEEIIPKLNQLKSLGKHEENEAGVYKNKEGVKTLFELMLKTKKTIYIMSATGKALEDMKYYFPNWHNRREKLRVKVVVLFNDELRNKEITKIPFSEIRYMPRSFSSPSTLFIFGDYIVNLLWADIPFAFVINSAKIGKSYRNYFKLIWKSAKP
ncbi:MAG: helix-turn-helix domain-containing protein [Candidatus Woesearchaeota archaeon]